MAAPNNKRIHNKVFAELARVAMMSNGPTNESDFDSGCFGWLVPMQFEMARIIRPGLALIRPPMLGNLGLSEL